MDKEEEDDEEEQDEKEKWQVEGQVEKGGGR